MNGAETSKCLISVQVSFEENKKPRRTAGAFNFGADDGNRTHTASLGSWSSTTKLHLQIQVDYIMKQRFCQFFITALLENHM